MGQFVALAQPRRGRRAGRRSGSCLGKHPRQDINCRERRAAGPDALALPKGVAAVSDGSNRPRSPRAWLRTVNTLIPETELEALRVCAQRGRPYGSSAWVERTVKQFGLESTMRGVGRPKRQTD